MKYSASAILILLTSAVFAQGSPAERIAPYLTDTALAVARVDLTTLDIDSARKQFQPFLDLFGLEADQIEQLAAGVKKARAAGFKEYYLVFDLAELHNDFGYAVMPIPEGMKPPEPGNAEYEIIIENAFIFGSPAIIEYFEGTPTASERAELASAFEAVAGAPIQIVVAPTADQRRILQEMLPDLSGEYGDVTGAELAASFEWAALGLKAEPELTTSLTIQSTTEEAAQTLQHVIAVSLETLSANEQILAVLPTAPMLVESLIPEQNGNRLTIQPQQTVNVVSEVFTKLVEIAQQSSRRRETATNLKQLALAMHNFHDTYKGFPPVASYSADGKPLLSWRVFMLPYLDETALYEQFHLDEPWDSGHNKALIEKMPDVFKSPRTPTEPGMTVFQVPTGDGLLFDGRSGKAFKDITDGTSNTIMFVETTAEQAVPWTKPDDLEVDPAKPLVGLVENRDGFWTTFADGSARFIGSGIDPEVMKKILTRAGGEVVDNDEIP